MDIEVKPSRALGYVEAPPSKSMAHRLLIAAALSEGTSHISNVAYSEDILATLDCIRAMGAGAEAEGSLVTVTGADLTKRPGGTCFPCRESGSTIRFFMALAMLSKGQADFYGSETLLSRPFSVYEEICRDQGIAFERQGDHIRIAGRLIPGNLSVKGNVSSQFITGLLFVLPLLDKDSTITFTTEVESKSYLDLTLSAMKSFGVKAEWTKEGNLFVPGGQKYRPQDLAVEGDYSNAAFLDIFNYCGGQVTTGGLIKESLQGDRVYRDYFEKLKKEAATVDITDCPDLGPVLMICAAVNHGGTLTGTRRLKMKESDRGTVMCAELAKFGVETDQQEDSISVKKCPLHAPSETVSGHNDHRIVMSFTTLMTLTGGKLSGAQAVRKSFPDYFDKIKALGIEVKENGMDQ